MDSKRSAINQTSMEAASPKLIEAEICDLEVANEVEEQGFCACRRSKIRANVAAFVKIVLTLAVILSTVLASIGYLEPGKANTTIKALADLHSALVGTIEWMNATRIN